MSKLTGNFIREWRKKRGISARVLALELGYNGRTYIKKIEGGSLPVTIPFTRKFVRFKNETETREIATREIQSPRPLPPRLKILATPRKCKFCGEWFIFPYPHQRVCTSRTCQSAAKSRRARTRARRTK